MDFKWLININSELSFVITGSSVSALQTLRSISADVVEILLRVIIVTIFYIWIVFHTSNYNIHPDTKLLIRNHSVNSFWPVSCS